MESHKVLQNPKDSVVLTVYFNGTAFEAGEGLQGTLRTLTKVQDDRLKMSFDGCGVAYGLSGTLFGTGVDKQAEEVVSRVKELLKEGKRVVVNAYGHSRGGISCLLLAKMLGLYDQDLVEVNLALMDPVPGNLVTSSKIDFTHRTLARQAMDLTACRNLKSVLAIYPREPLANYLFHAPIFPTYPSHTKVTEEIIPGCHAGAQQGLSSNQNSASVITQGLVSKYLRENGTELADVEGYRKLYDADEMRQAFNRCALNISAPTSRPCHAKSYTRIVAAPAAADVYFSPLHHALAENKPVASLEPDAQYQTKIIRSRFFKPSYIAPKEKPPANELLGLFIELMNEIKLSDKSEASTKGELIRDLRNQCAYIQQVNNRNFSEKDLKDIMRNAFALYLQRDRHRFSLISLTRSGRQLKRLLNNKKYQALNELVLNKPDRSVYHADLRSFVRGSSERSYFNSRHKDKTYQFFKVPQTDVKDRLKYTSNNVRFYLSR